MTTSVAPVGSRTTWNLDPSHSHIEFSAKHMMITTVKGRFAKFEGTIVADEGDVTNASVDVTIKAASIDTRTDQRDAHLRSAEFLDAETFPSVSFKSTRVEGTRDKLKLTGDLTIRGTTRPITLDVTYEGAGKDPWGGQRVSFAATGKLDRREFGLTWNQALEAGGILVSNDVKISIEVQAIQATEG